MMSLKAKPDNEFEKQGVTFKIITEDMFDDVKDFMWENFFPDEPISRYVIADIRVVGTVNFCLDLLELQETS